MASAFGAIFGKLFADAPAVRFLRMEGQGETVAQSLAPFLDLYSPGLVGLQPLAVRTARRSDFRPRPGYWGTSMNPLFTEVSTMTITSPIHSFFRALTALSRTASHPEALQERHLNTPRRIDDPATAARLARELLHSRREDITLALYMDDRHRFVGHAIVATGWVQSARLSAQPIVIGAQASRATGCVLIRYRRYGLLSATEVEQRSFRSIAGACWHHRLTVVDHLVVVGNCGYDSAFFGAP